MSWRVNRDKWIHIYCDGACSGNPGPATYAYIVTYGDGQFLDVGSRFIGHATNIAAEYEAIIQGLISVLQSTYYNGESIIVYSDSEVVIKQLNGVYRVKAEHLKSKYQWIKDMEKHYKIPRLTFKWVEREHRMIRECDRMARKVMRVDY